MMTAAAVRAEAERVGARDRLEQFEILLRDEAQRQNLISRSTWDDLWVRHIGDSLQLLPLAPPDGLWVDIGTGAGFPGLVIAAASSHRPFLLVEPRAKRADFLRRCVDVLALGHVRVETKRAEAILADVPTSVISARAVASLSSLLAMTTHLRDSATTYLLPRGRHAEDDIASVATRWSGVFHVEQSRTNTDAKIVIATQVKPR